ncbi:hypothetical protein C1646_720819 [Rhizophagus diaphanus]|nr:hypothetical protein C1646_720819 [Rhizophagus diaphanus] [Rhizophagus sp. MUCL 43196]
MEDVIEKDKNSHILYDQNNLKLSYLENPLGESPSFFTLKINENERENIINATDEIIDSYLKRNNIGWSRDFSFPKILEKHKSIANKIFGNLINNQTIRQYEVMVGYFYEDGFGVSKNEIVAFEWYKKASKLNNLNGQFELGYCYNYGYSIKKNLEEALKSYKLASDKGLNIATYFLAVSYEFDNEKNSFDEAFKLYKKSAEKGFIPSQYKLATFYEIGKGTQQNKTEALKWYKLFLENNGEYNPTYNIKDTIMENSSLSIKSLINDIEREITRNELDEIIEAYLKYNSIGETKSFSFFKVLKNYESKSQEIFKCLNNNQTIRNYEVIVGKFHEMGFGTNENMDKAFKWYMDASKQNNYNGILETGNCYYNGNGVVKNCDKAFEFFQRAVNESKEKLNRALYSLATCYKSGDGIRKNETNQQLLRVHQVKAFELYKKSAENGFVLSQRELAECYKDGIGTQKNRDEASKWEKKYMTSQNELSKKL